jgi:hypothetical protein
MNDSELRALVREAVERHLGRVPAPGSPAPTAMLPGADEPWRGHASHAVYLTVVNTDDACVIEPNVGCHHCQYCKSHGY